MHYFGRSANELFGNKSISVLDDAIIAEQSPRDRYCIRIGQRSIKRTKCVIAHMDVYKFVYVHRDNLIGRLNQGMGFGDF